MEDQNPLSSSNEAVQIQLEATLQSKEAPPLPSAPSQNYSRSTIRKNHPPSCTTCRRRKVKCDRADPCFQCVRTGAICVFVPHSGAPRGRKGGRRKLDRELLHRIASLEHLVKDFEGRSTGEAAAVPAPDNGNFAVCYYPNSCTCPWRHSAKYLPLGGR